MDDAVQGVEGYIESLRHHLRAEDAGSLVTITYTKLWTRSETMRSNLILQLLVNGLSTGALYGIVALGFGFIYNTTKVFHIAHGLIFTASGYILYSAYIGAKVPFIIAVLLSLAGAALLGFSIEFFIYRPLGERRASKIIPFIASLGVYILLQNLIPLIYGYQPLIVASQPLQNNYDKVIITPIQRVEILCFGVVCFLLYLLLAHTRFGKSLRAIADNPVLAEVIGLDVNALRIGVFVIGSVLAGLGGILSSFDIGVDPNAGLSMALVAIISVVIGGVGIFEGALLGGLTVGLIQSLAVGVISGAWQNTATFLLLIIILLFRPEGILGFKRRLTEVRA